MDRTSDERSADTQRVPGQETPPGVTRRREATANPEQVDYRLNPSFGDRAVPQGGPSYDRPIEPCAVPVAPQPNAQHQLTPEETALELKQPTLDGFSPDSDCMLRWERERSGFG